MTKPVIRKSKWLVGLILLAVFALFISGGCVPNTLPVISSLVLTNQGEINPGATTYITCTATDSDDDELSYTWSADGGTLDGGGANITWTAPNVVGSFTVTVEVSDGDDIVTDQLVIAVLAPNNPPTIASLITDCPRVRQGGTATLTCEATDPDGDELTYEWSSERGSFSGEGAVVSWVGPSEYGTFVITVTATDGRGGEATAEIAIIVCSCGSACD